MQGRQLRGLFRWSLLVAMLGLATSGCRIRSQQRQSPEQAFDALKLALSAQSPNHLFELLDQQTQWSIMSTLRAQRGARELVRRHYPPARRQRELQRTALAENAADAAAYLRAYSRQQAILPKIGDIDEIGGRRGTGDQVTLLSGGHDLAFCRDKEGWTYCGLREHFAQLSVRAARDLATVRESIEAAAQQR